ncbi:hypothetical protein ACFL27_13580 [candidate division CSSED10-310 bacterium]|uniref:Uncharacterized protein n=1 Tax=candidate division CSSED10-310 bacterium TaxID=2855610 RepID=A0ABV6YYS3_UNCC1
MEEQNQYFTLFQLKISRQPLKMSYPQVIHRKGGVINNLLTGYQQLKRQLKALYINGLWLFYVARY